MTKEQELFKSLLTLLLSDSKDLGLDLELPLDQLDDLELPSDFNLENLSLDNFNLDKVNLDNLDLGSDLGSDLYLNKDINSYLNLYLYLDLYVYIDLYLGNLNLYNLDLENLSLEDLENLAKKISKNLAKKSHLDIYKILKIELEQFNSNEENTNFKNETENISKILEDLIYKLENKKETIPFHEVIFNIFKLSTLQIRFNLANKQKNQLQFKELAEEIFCSYRKDTKILDFKNDLLEQLNNYKILEERIDGIENLTKKLRDNKTLTEVAKLTEVATLTEVIDKVKSLIEKLDNHLIPEEVINKTESQIEQNEESQEKVLRRSSRNKRKYTELITEEASNKKALYK